jgi:Uma2 family endonuclease
MGGGGMALADILPADIAEDDFEDAGVDIQDYWVVNLRLDVVEVLREPRKGIYQSRRIYRRGETISPVAKPEASVAVDDLLPRHAKAS